MAGKKRKSSIAVMTVLLSAAIFAQNTFAFDVDENSKERSELENQTSEYYQELDETQNQIEKKESEVKNLQKKIAELSKKITDSNEKIKILNTQIKRKQAQIDEKLEAIDDRLDALRIRLRAIYMQGDTSSLEIILGAKDFSDFVDKAEIIKNISDYDDKLIKSLQSEMGVISQEQEELKKNKENVEKEKSSLEKNKKEINELNEQNTKIIEELNESKNNIEENIKQNNNMQKELEKALAQYNKELAEQAKAERQKQLLKQLEQQQKQQQQQQQNQQQKKQQQNSSNSPEIVVESDDHYVWPCPGYTYLTSTFDEWRGENNHGALDIADAGIYGAKVVACYNGTVISTNSSCPHDYGKSSSCGCGGGYGNYVMIDHGGGKISIYGHLSGVTVSAGQTVVGGQLIGYVGSTGYSTGPHLHFEMQYNGVRYDPLTEYE